MVLPELLGRILAGDPLENLLAARVVVLELCEVVYVTVDDDPERIGLVVRRNVALAERFRHGFCLWASCENLISPVVADFKVATIKRQQRSG